VHVAAGGTFTATRAVFRDLHVSGDGGAIVSYGIVRVKQSWFLDCTADRWGGAMALLEGANAAVINTVEDCTVARCVSETGGAIDVGVPNFRLRRSHFIDNSIACTQPPYSTTGLCHATWTGAAASGLHERADQLSTAVFWWGHNGYGEPAPNGEADGATCGGSDGEGYSGTCWENDLIMAIPAPMVVLVEEADGPELAGGAEHSGR